MKKKDLITVALLIFLFAIYSIMDEGADNDPYKDWREYIGNDPYDISFKKVELKEDIPVSVLENIEQLNLEGNLVRGSWCFNPNFFEVDLFYFMICGGEEYQSGYDVTISEAVYEYYNPNIENPLSDLTFGDLSCDLIINESGKSAVNYNADFAVPLVLFVVNEREADELHLWIEDVNQQPLLRQNNFPLGDK